MMIPEELFGLAGPKEAQNRYKDLLKKVHPDVCKDSRASELFLEVQGAYQDYNDREKKGLLRDISKSKIIYSSKDKLFCNNVSYFEFDIKNKSFVFDKIFDKPTFPSETIKKNIIGYLPNFPVETKKIGDRVQIKVKHREDIYPLSAILKNYKVDVRDRFWIVSCLWNLGCYFSVIKVAPLDLNIDNIFIDPITHSICLVGGWWYTEVLGKQIKALPKKTYDILPYHVKMNKECSNAVTVSQIRHIMKDLEVDKINNVFSNFLKHTETDIIKLYGIWSKEVLPSYGERKFFVDGLTKEFNTIKLNGVKRFN